MSEIREDGASFIGYEYCELPCGGPDAGLRLDAYQSFGWTVDERAAPDAPHKGGALRLRRDRRLVNRTELIRLQRHFESCMAELDALERSKTEGATACAILVGLAGCGLLAGSVFAVSAPQPLYLLSALLGLPGLAAWAASYFLYRRMVRRRTAAVGVLVEHKYDEIDDICRRAQALL